MCRYGVKSAHFEFISVFAAFYSTEVSSATHSGSCKINDEFTAVFDDVVRKTLRADRYIGHSRTGADYTCPANREDIRLFDCAA